MDAQFNDLLLALSFDDLMLHAILIIVTILPEIRHGKKDIRGWERRGGREK